MYAQLTHSPLGGMVAKRAGLPRPLDLDRFQAGRPLIEGRVLLGAAPGGGLAEPVARILRESGAEGATIGDQAREAAAGARLDATIFNPAAAGDQRFKGLILDASGIADSGRLIELHSFFHHTARRIDPCARAILLGTPPGACGSPAAATAQRSLEGFTRSLGKEIGKGATVQLVYVAPGAEGLMASTLRFLLSPRSAYVSGQVIEIGAGLEPPELDWERPLAGRTALVTGASRGIGEAIASTLARDGAHVIGLDVEGASAELKRVTESLGGEGIELDITTQDAPRKLAERCGDGLDVVVHNAGVTRDRTIAKMPAELWSELIDINLSSQERIDDELLERGLLRENGRIVCVSSMNGIAGAAGQTNYATSKAGIIGRVHALAPLLAQRGATINAVAPGFIETQMTAAMPLIPREAGRRMNSLSQGGLALDVAETIAWLASPASSGVNGNVVRVCGQSLLGA